MTARLWSIWGPLAIWGSRRRKLRGTEAAAIMVALVAGAIGVDARLTDAAVDAWSNGGSDGNWANVNNWLGHTLPAASDDVSFPAGQTIATTQYLGTSARTWYLEAVDEAGATNVTIAGPTSSYLWFENGTGFYTPGIILESSFGSNSSSGTMLISSSCYVTLAANSTFQVKNRTNNNPNLLEIDARINESGGSRALTISGAGIVFLSNANNSYSGGTTVNGGVLQIDSFSNLGTGTLSLGAGTLRFHSAYSGSPTFTITSASSTVDTNGKVISLNGGISGVGTLNVTDSTMNGGILTLSGSNGYTGGTNIQSGTLRLGSLNAMGTDGITVSTGGTLDLYGVGQITGHNLVLDDGGVGSAGALINSNSTTGASWAGGVTLGLNPAKISAVSADR
jgi:autotransporter-associated beta strand protein